MGAVASPAWEGTWEGVSLLALRARLQLPQPPAQLQQPGLRCCRPAQTPERR